MAAMGGGAGGAGGAGGGGGGYGWDPARGWPSGFQPALESKEKSLIAGTKHDPRVRAGQQAGEAWGAGLDEEIATRIQKQRMARGAMDPDLAAVLTWTRERTSDLVWKTAAGGVAGHPGAVKNDPRLRGFVSKEHNTRDRLRYEGVATELSAYDAGTASAHDVAIKARLMTVQQMMSPGEELATAASSAFVQSTAVGRLDAPGAIGALAGIQQHKRETIKWETARDMVTHGAAPLVPDVFQHYLGQPGSTVPSAMAAFSADVAAGKVAPNTAATSQTDDLRAVTIKAAASSAPVGRPRALSNPRRLV